MSEPGNSPDSSTECNSGIGWGLLILFLGTVSSKPLLYKAVINITAHLFPAVGRACSLVGMDSGRLPPAS
ncbi:hypothetical protein GN956_G10994 [Arapaima gigas]